MHLLIVIIMIIMIVNVVMITTTVAKGNKQIMLIVRFAVAM